MDARTGGAGLPPAETAELFDCTGLDLEELRASRNPVLLAVIERLRTRLVEPGPGTAAFSDYTSAPAGAATPVVVPGAEEP
ncbi:FxSxx-COOH cyclophane-containing RiPP peptide [Streptacidiphilus jiangxiensis]|uniref:FXSXX-COOH protein n=1 Tax=Streptacidiphilus jiangxiensis TaxID=235985 RepID=A0A1H7G2N2_STRJI|nr:FxSxx-COOH cyclophane-containing RiPP peptide [Streptacidiphilus jiangxiensis]SEK32378.1 FXSXX-COOH protein [Streptacidiphilus jiangxiensis]